MEVVLIGLIVAISLTMTDAVSELSVPVNSTVSFTCSPKFSSYVQQIRWFLDSRQDDLPVPVYNGLFVNPALASRFSVLLNSTTGQSKLRIVDVEPRDAGTYYCREATSAESNAVFSLTVIANTHTVLTVTTFTKLQPSTVNTNNMLTTLGESLIALPSTGLDVHEDPQLIATNESTTHLVLRNPQMSKENGSPVTKENPAEIPFIGLGLVVLAAISIVCLTIIVVVVVRRRRLEDNRQHFRSDYLPTGSTCLLTTNVAYKSSEASKETADLPSWPGDRGIYIHPGGEPNGNGHYSDISARIAEHETRLTGSGEELDKKCDMHSVSSDKQHCSAIQSVYMGLYEAADNGTNDTCTKVESVDENTLVKGRDAVKAP
jgi:hypothetical protein